MEHSFEDERCEAQNKRLQSVQVRWWDDAVEDEEEEGGGGGLVLVLDEGGGFKAIMVELVAQAHLQKRVAGPRAVKVGMERVSMYIDLLLGRRGLGKG